MKKGRQDRIAETLTIKNIQSMSGCFARKFHNVLLALFQ